MQFGERESGTVLSDRFGYSGILDCDLQSYRLQAD
jgi:hypothetical protein